MNDEKMKIGDEVAFHWDDGRPDTVVVITHIGYDGFIDGMDAKRYALCVKESAEMDENREAFSDCNPVVKADEGREVAIRTT